MAGVVTLKTRIAEEDAELTFVVVKDAPQAILGIPGLRRFGIQIDFGADSLKTSSGW